MSLFSDFQHSPKMRDFYIVINTHYKPYTVHITHELNVPPLETSLGSKSCSASRYIHDRRS